LRDIILRKEMQGSDVENLSPLYQRAQSFQAREPWTAGVKGKEGGYRSKKGGREEEKDAITGRVLEEEAEKRA